MTPLTPRRRFLAALAGAAPLVAVRAASAAGGSPDTLMLPPGPQGAISLDLTRPLCIRGSGVGVTTVPNIDIAANGHEVTISDLTVRNGRLSIINDHFRHAYIERVHVWGQGQSGPAIHLKNTLGASLRDCFVQGYEVGYFVEGTPYESFGGNQRALITRIDGCHADSCGTGFKFIGNQEGLYVSHCEAIGVQYGFFYAPGIHAPGTAFVGCHANYTHAGIQLEQVTGVKVLGAFLFRHGDVPLAVGVRLYKTWYCHVADSSFHNIGGGAASFGVLADGEGGHDHQIVNNTIHGATFAGVGLIDGTRDCTVTGNRFRHGGAPYFQRGTSGNVFA